MSKLLYSSLVAGIIASLLSGCQFRAPVTDDLSKLRNIDVVNDKTFSLSGLRYHALRDAALSVGARSGLAWRAEQIREKISLHEKNLDHIFNFRGLVLDDNVVPPVLIEGRMPLEVASTDTLRIADRHYLIIKQAHFASNPPTWRDYLKMEFSEPDLPDRSLLPRDETEKNVWDRYVQEGWRAGIVQANTIFLEQLGRLKRDYQGMVRYHTLLAQNIVSKPFVGRTELGITGGSEEMAVNDRVLRITAKPSLNQDTKSWKADVIASLPKDEVCVITE